MKPRPGGTPYDFEGEPGETATITISPIIASNTFVVSKPAQRQSGGQPGADHTVYTYVLNRPAGEAQIIRMKFRFLEEMPANVSPDTWPRFEITVQGDRGDTSVHEVPDILQLSTAPVPSEQEVEFIFVVAGRGGRKKARKKVARKKSR